MHIHVYPHVPRYVHSYPRHHRGLLTEFACMLGQDLSRKLDLSGIYRLLRKKRDGKEIAALMHKNLLDGGELGDHFEISLETYCSTLASIRSHKDGQMLVLTFSFRNLPIRVFFSCVSL